MTKGNLIYDTDDFNTFVEEMEESGFEVEHYNGRFNFSGPAARCEHYSDVMAATTVRCQYDNMGLSYIVYPIGHGNLIEQEKHNG